jgi:ERCC4-type nuclease
LIHIDTRVGSKELSKHIPEGRYTFGTFPADFLVSGVQDIYLERKVINDYITSFFSGRIIPQLDGLKEFPYKILLIEGWYRIKGELQTYQYGTWQNLGYGSKKITKDMFLGSMITLLFEYSIPTIFTLDPAHSAGVLLAIDNWNQKDKHNSFNRNYFGGHAENSLSLCQKIAMCLPGIGYEKSHGFRKKGIDWIAEGMLLKDDRWKEIEKIGETINKGINEKLEEEK